MGIVARARRLWFLVVGLGVVMLGLVFAGAAVADEPDENVENFQFSSWDLTYDIGLDDQGRAQADVTEELVAEFPQTDQNRG
ncbi:MAG TPA: DUF2207 domain-containing protein, partial [Candidatus Yaniella excrementavium]|nr:DUF2207 domain-containing protein [Candidatus Yaniella excrementavium]